jgi:ribosomal protein L32
MGRTLKNHEVMKNEMVYLWSKKSVVMTGLPFRQSLAEDDTVTMLRSTDCQRHGHSHIPHRSQAHLGVHIRKEFLEEIYPVPRPRIRGPEVPPRCTHRGHCPQTHHPRRLKPMLDI